MPHGVNGREHVPVWMDVGFHVLGHEIDEFGTGREGPGHERLRGHSLSRFSRPAHVEYARIEHASCFCFCRSRVIVGSSLLEARMASEPNAARDLYPIVSITMKVVAGLMQDYHFVGLLHCSVG